jgi:DNA helicase HerA-like ATPase
MRNERDPDWQGTQQVHLLAKFGNRHGLIAGATGTGKTVSLLVLAEGFSRLGVPVFIADVKGDVAGLALPGSGNEKVQQRVAQMGRMGYASEGSPVVFWDLYGHTGHPVRTAAETFVANPGLDVARVISQLAVGEALVSTLQENGVPSPVERALICPPRCRTGAITPEERTALRARSPLGSKYDGPVNRESAHEILAQRAVTVEAERTPTPSTSGRVSEDRGAIGDLLWGSGRGQGMVETMAKQAARTMGSGIGRQILRGVLGGILVGKRR